MRLSWGAYKEALDLHAMCGTMPASASSRGTLPYNAEDAL